jgi:hypothetical protein
MRTLFRIGFLALVAIFIIVVFVNIRNAGSQSVIEPKIEPSKIKICTSIKCSEYSTEEYGVKKTELKTKLINEEDLTYDELQEVTSIVNTEVINNPIIIENYKGGEVPIKDILIDILN